MIDSDGFRPNVGIILTDGAGRVFWARRIGQNAWQFPQGGIKRHESPQQALFRELREEVGLESSHVEVLGCTEGWLRYRLPRHLVRRRQRPLCIGQKQVWFMLRLACDEGTVCLDQSAQPEFDDWRWVDYWEPVQRVVFFKRRVYDRALTELAPLIFPDGPPQRPLPRGNGQGRRD
ncbi:RNA pyrophosphohydrolase [Arhodomonas sp. KWT]|uniref:RNA pyrophosphohydrolase n=1 Tax=Arhodomonas sp. KWT TaxID=2679915 RepID=UPI0013D05539|nr:RNA pyrophosphohydrolase [Arhodomonas sp. KWT]